MVSVSRRPVSAPPIPRCPPMPHHFGTPLRANAQAKLKDRGQDIQKMLMVGRFTEAGYARAMDQLKFIKTCFVGGDLKSGLTKGAPLKVSERIESIKNTLMTSRFSDPAIRASYENEIKFLQGLQARAAAK